MKKLWLKAPARPEVGQGLWLQTQLTVLTISWDGRAYGRQADRAGPPPPFTAENNLADAAMRLIRAIARWLRAWLRW
jgi:hypothetical protein